MVVTDVMLTLLEAAFTRRGGLANLRTRDDPTTGSWVPDARLWPARMLRDLKPDARDALVDALVFTVRLDGRVTDAEGHALDAQVAEFADAYKLPPAEVAAVVNASIERVRAVTQPVGYRVDAVTARDDAEREFVASIAKRVDAPRVRRELFRTIVRIARGSASDVHTADRAVRWFAAAFELDESDL